MLLDLLVHKTVIYPVFLLFQHALFSICASLLCKMALLRIFLILALVVLAQAILFEIPEVAEVVDEIKSKFSGYIHYDGSDIAVHNLTARGDLIEERQSGAYWYEQIAHRGIAATGPGGYQVYRNVKDFGARGMLNLLEAFILHC